MKYYLSDFVENDYYFFIFFWDIHYPIKFQMWKMLMAEFPEDEFPKNIEMDGKFIIYFDFKEYLIRDVRCRLPMILTRI